MTDGYLSHDKAHVAAQQRARRARMVRIDYMPGRQALAVLQARQAKERPGSVAATNSATLDAILIEWAELTGLKWKLIDRPKGPAGHTGINGPLRTHARMTPAATPQEHGKARGGGALKVWTDSGCRPAVHPCILAKSKYLQMKQLSDDHPARPRRASAKTRCFHL